MRVAFDFVFTVLFIFDSMGISSGVPPKTMDLLANFGKSNESALDHGDSHAGTSSYSDKNPSARPHTSTKSPPNAEPPRRSRTRSPPAMNGTSLIRIPYPNVLGYGLDQLKFIRIISYKNPQRQFELRRFKFPADTPIEVLEGTSKYRPIPTQEQIVLTSSDGDVFAILDSNETLAGLYTYNAGVYAKKRSKINMNSGKITLLTAEEIKETPVGFRRQLLYSYRVEHSIHDHRSLALAELPIASTHSSPPKHIPLPTRLPSSDGYGYELDQLQFIRLKSLRNPTLIFELRRYTIPADKLILYLEERSHFEPVPVQELIVLTTVSGEVFAILESMDYLIGIYAYHASTRTKSRIKMNIQSGMITRLTKNEMSEVPVGRVRSIIFNFEIKNVNPNPPRSPQH